jgi:mycofactocin system transcriptional regulator
VSIAAGRVGRPRLTTRDDIERVAIGLFASAGYAQTTVDDIAAAAGISRRTFFRYFGSKNDVVWGRFDDGLSAFAASLAAQPVDTPVTDALRRCIVEFNAFPAEQVSVHRQRMTLILSVPELQAHSTLMYAAWRRVVAEFVGSRSGRSADDLGPRLVGHVMLGAAVAAYEQWLAQPAGQLTTLLDTAVAAAADGVLRQTTAGDVD